MSAGPLDGLRVIDAGLLVQGPQAAAMLADMGADVIKVELPGFGDQSRNIRIAPDDARSAYFAACNRGKRSLTLDLRKDDGAQIFLKLAVDADVVISNFKLGTMDGWGLGYEALSARNPRLIFASGNAFGPAGPDRYREGADLAGQCAAGLISTTGADGDPPSPVGVTIADHVASLNMVCGILAALQHVQRTGQGQKVEVSLVGGQLWAQAAEFTHYFMTGEQPGRANYGHPLIHAPYRIFATADSWIGLIGIPYDALDAFLIAIERTDLLVDEKLVKSRVRSSNLDWFLGELEESFKTKTTDEWCELLRDAGVRYAPVRNYDQVVADSGFWDNEYFVRSEGDDDDVAPRVATPIRMSATAIEHPMHVPALGEHTDEVLEELGLSPDEIASLRDKEVL